MVEIGIIPLTKIAKPFSLMAGFPVVYAVSNNKVNRK